MTLHYVNEFLKQLDRLKKLSGSLNEQTIRGAFRQLLADWARGQNLTLIEELEYETRLKTKVYPDATILHDLRVPLGYWEAKDTQDNLNEEIEKKFRKGYPKDNIIFENSHTAVLYQNGIEVARVADMLDTKALHHLLSLFFSYERQEIHDFRKAVGQFKQDIPAVLEALREKIDAAYAANKPFQTTAQKFLKHAKDTINPALTEADVREMLIQHILTEEIFAHVFNNSDFHRENNIAKELYALESQFFTGQVKRETLKSLETYYATIRANAALITSHTEKQTFLKVIYENFYKVYNPKAADRLGVVYTPQEIVRFMIESADWLCQKHFGKSLIDRDVEILDPATGTGTFICELIEHFRGDAKKLKHKYENELHANEVAILPYYVANLNIEATYAAITGSFAEYPNLCFVDTLDNVAGLGIRSGFQHEFFGAMSEENIERVKRQNKRKITVVIGNPPYNANQANENDNNKNREYKRIDQRIKDTYIKQSTAQKTKQYDPFVRFIRWASDRVHDDGMLAFIVNRKFIDGKNFDGFRKAIAKEFNDIWVVDLGGDYKIKGIGGGENVFGIGTGVAILFLIKSQLQKQNFIFYLSTGCIKASDKLAWLNTMDLSEQKPELIKPDEKGYWVDFPQNEFISEIRLASKETKKGLRGNKNPALFKNYSLGISTNRDEWVYGFSNEGIIQTFQYLKDIYCHTKNANLDKNIKWSRNLKRRHKSQEQQKDNLNNRDILYRPFIKKILADSNIFVDERGAADQVFLKDNFCIGFTDPTGQKPWMVMACNVLPDLHMVGSGAGTVCIGRYSFYSNGEKIDNITDWGLKQFVDHYGKDKKRPITKDTIFHYVYGVLHDPVYREKYALNLKREFPRLPFYNDFWQWATWGEQLMELHIGFEEVVPFDLQRSDTTDTKAREAKLAPKTMLKADKENGVIILDSETRLCGIPREAWDYRLGNRSALEWILDQYKEKTPKDPTIREKFNTYRFADYKEKVIDLLLRVTRVSVETVAITEAMKEMKR